MVEELYQMYTGEEKSFNILEHDHCVVVRVTPYTWELFTKTENIHTSVYRESYGFKHLDKLVLDIKGIGYVA